VRAGTTGQDLRRSRACHQVIGDAQRRTGVQRLGDAEAAQEQDHLRGRRKLVSH
jgi:hypothetical protein